LKVHFIAIGGAAMHNLAMALKIKGYDVTGSDDEIFNPSRSRLEKYNILPVDMGWYPEKITKDLDAVILGMHARIDNPELNKAKELGLPIFSYPEYIYEQSKNKIRIVIGGSHGKTSITAMILHALEKAKIDCDYMVGAQLPQFECMVKLSESAKYIILEGDEYLSSPIDLRPKFHLYKPHVALLSGIAWDHINVFPTFENYISQFRIFINLIEPEGKLIFFEGDDYLKMLAVETDKQIDINPYSIPDHVILDGQTFIETDDGRIPMEIFGEHNLQNLNGARLVCNTLNISDIDFYKSMQDFGGAANRLELIERFDKSVFYKDFAHSPSKLKATTKALKNQFPDRKLVACMELHTFSSLNKDFLPLYSGTMDMADLPFVFFNPEVVKHKKLEGITKDEIFEAFKHEGLKVFTNSEELIRELKLIDWEGHNLLMMSSGNFNGVDYTVLASTLFKVYN
jgi:UDP-N-acetylmuramate: L-alanyl-gamma-D-glutamyl-meso-diaminopimelate ligase